MMNKPIGLPKPTLRELVNRHTVSAIRISHVANIPILTIRAMIAGIQKSEAIQQHVLQAFNRIADTQYTYNEVDLCGSLRNLNRSAANGS